MKYLFQRSVAGLMSLAMLLSIAPVSAQEAVPIRVDIDAETRVLLDPTDPPLERHAKLHRAWTVYREHGSDQIWAIRKDGTTKHEVQTLAFFTAFEANYHILLVAPGRLDRFAIGDPITDENFNPDDFRKTPFRCRLVKVADHPAVYLLCHNRKRVVLRAGVFHRFGWEFRDVEIISQAELDAYVLDDAIDEETVFDEVVEVATTEARLLRERLMKRLELRDKRLVRDRLIKLHDRPEIYVIMPDGQLRHIASLEVAIQLGLNLRETTEVSADELAAFNIASEITADTSAAVLNQEAF